MLSIFPETVRAEVRVVLHRLVRGRLVQEREAPAGREHQLHGRRDGRGSRGTPHHRGAAVEDGQLAHRVGEGERGVQLILFLLFLNQVWF